MKYQKGDRVRVVGYLETDPVFGILVGKTGTVDCESAYVHVRLDDMPLDMDHVWLFRHSELEPLNETNNNA